jgi:S-adenosylmethionine/arginine decarboxylase-like enzyme
MLLIGSCVEAAMAGGHLCSYDYMMKDEEGNDYNNKGAGYINIFSCKDFSPTLAIACVERHFKPTSMKYKCYDRI